jgi:RNA polymerase sigma factor (TIGR02999 family)
LTGSQDQNWSGRTHFFAAAAEAMRRILIDNARRKQRLKRGGAQQRVDLEKADITFEDPSTNIIALDEALEKLAQEDQVKADLVKLRYFAGLTIEQSAEILSISRATAERYWSYARAWLFDEINKDN